MIDYANLIQSLEARVLYVSIKGETITEYRIFVEKLPEKKLTWKTRKEKRAVSLRGSHEDRLRGPQEHGSCSRS